MFYVCDTHLEVSSICMNMHHLEVSVISIILFNVIPSGFNSLWSFIVSKPAHLQKSGLYNFVISAENLYAWCIILFYIQASIPSPINITINSNSFLWDISWCDSEIDSDMFLQFKNRSQNIYCFVISRNTSVYEIIDDPTMSKK